MTTQAPIKPASRQRSFLIPAAVVALLIVGAVAAYAYDSSRADMVANGVSVAGVNVGGMQADKARATLRSELGRRLERPIEVVFRNHRYELSPRQVGLKPEVDKMVDEAVKKSRDGNIIGRVFRDVTGGDEKADLPGQVAYSRRAADRFVKGVERKLNRPARDARLEFPSLRRVKEQDGVKVSDDSFRQRVKQALAVPSIDRVSVPVQITHPRVTQGQLAAKYPTLIVVERSSFTLTYYRRLRKVKSYTIAVGQQGLETPAGLYKIETKQVDPPWYVPNSAWAGSLAGTVVPGGTSQNPLKARWLGIANGAGIHGTDNVGSLGTAASHGCIRMAIPEVIELYSKVPLGATVYIA